ncbi:tRNA pseudouridine synthase 1 [Lasiodiplodia theobromae]|uniref:tRNA pseudouridine synthase 1 n=1 Tax=Lasiodiplodia theobromae TaxID=45133 RepID=A0A5N5DLX5_9PEZI|nr:tRNA pseudouridine synthase 1 [Lasiodiplodia theobromae]
MDPESAKPEAQSSESAMDPKPTDSETTDAPSGNGDKKQWRDKGVRGNKRKWQQGGNIQHGSRDKRARNEDEKAKRRRLEAEGIESVLPKAFSKEEVEAEERRPKRKVVVMIGYSGSGYKGMQIMPNHRTIEGDLFTAFVKAGAISKANADDPKKSALVRCARTDKGVHAAGNVISLKLIIEDPDIVEKINSHLSPQIRVWGIERTTGSFSAYQAVDSRWYEYLIPTYSFLPPHPNSYLGKKLVELADEAGDREGYESRQEEVADFWRDVDEKHIKPALEQLKPWVRELVEKALWESETDPEAPNEKTNEAAAEEAADMAQPVRVGGENASDPMNVDVSEKTEEAAIIINEPGITKASEPMDTDTTKPESAPAADESVQTTDDDPNASAEDDMPPTDPEKLTLGQKRAIESAIKKIKAIYMDAKKAYRVPAKRIDRLRDALNAYVGTKNYHNYTVNKKFKDPSAKRLIKSFKAAEEPIIINGTEWISLKVHGQSFMMHQIRKMVGMAALVVRCGCPVDRIAETFGDVDVAIPKVPGLGLLLERPVFDSYNAKAADKFNREKVEFTKYEKVMEEFKQREIYERIFREEEESNQFNQFFAHIDGYKEPFFLYLSSKGIKASTGPEAEKAKDKSRTTKPKEFNGDSESDAEAGDG